MISLSATRGSDVVFVITMKQPNNTPIDLTGRTIAFFDIPKNLTGRISGSIVDATAGKIQVNVEGTDPITLGNYIFRLQINDENVSNVDSLALPKIELRII
jgi:hypothetical protein